ncbi:MAG: hypothetical protein K0U47_00115 [Epsilonproteobacteria bacterium]|nr:hypothetical protein [Campylobacterota bacterium]
MQTIIYKSHPLYIQTTSEHPFLISHQDLAKICHIHESYLDLLINLHPLLIVHRKHYLMRDNTTYWTKYGIIRICTLMGNDVAIDFADFIEAM